MKYGIVKHVEGTKLRTLSSHMWGAKNMT